MITERQKEARRRNGARSRGPKTPEGKAISRLNAMKHGIYSEVTVIAGENEAELVAFGKALRTQLAPVGELEIMLADRIVSIAWRLRRLVNDEAKLFEKALEDPQERGFSYLFLGHGGDRMVRLNRYEATLDRSLYKTLRELENLQAARRSVETKRSTKVLEADSDVVEAELALACSDEGGTVGSFRQNVPANQVVNKAGRVQAETP